MVCCNESVGHCLSLLFVVLSCCVFIFVVVQNRDKGQNDSFNGILGFVYLGSNFHCPSFELSVGR